MRIRFENEQESYLRELADKTGITPTNFLRGLLDQHIKNEDSKNWGDYRMPTAKPQDFRTDRVAKNNLLKGVSF